MQIIKALSRKVNLEYSKQKALKNQQRNLTQQAVDLMQNRDENLDKVEELLKMEKH